MTCLLETMAKKEILAKEELEAVLEEAKVEQEVKEELEWQEQPIPGRWGRAASLMAETTASWIGFHGRR